MTAIFPHGADITLISDPSDPFRKFGVKAVLTPDQIWAHNLTNRISLIAAGSMFLLMISIIGLGLKDKRVGLFHGHDQPKSAAQRFFMGMAILGGCGFLGSFLGCAYSSYVYHKI